MTKFCSHLCEEWFGFKKSPTQDRQTCMVIDFRWTFFSTFSSENSETGKLRKVSLKLHRWNCRTFWMRCRHRWRIWLRSRVERSAKNNSSDEVKLLVQYVGKTIWVFPKMVVPPISTPKWSFLVGKPMVVGETLLGNPPYIKYLQFSIEYTLSSCWVFFRQLYEDKS